MMYSESYHISGLCTVNRNNKRNEWLITGRVLNYGNELGSRSNGIERLTIADRAIVAFEMARVLAVAPAPSLLGLPPTCTVCL